MGLLLSNTPWSRVELARDGKQLRGVEVAVGGRKLWGCDSDIWAD